MNVFKTLNKRSSLFRTMQILLMATIEVVSIYFLLKIFGSNLYEVLPSELKGHGIWTFVALLISAPIAFLVWKFRDENTIQQLENQRKDVNLKEFQKIAEWVSGLHLVEDKIIEKTKKIEKPAENNPSEQWGNQEEATDTTLETETSREYGQAGQSRHIPSHSRQDGAVGLQIAAINMLKPFYCGEHGDGFRKPALNLLTSAWLALFKQEEENYSNQNLDNIKNSPLTIALTEVLLTDGGKHFLHHKDSFSNIYLPYLNANLFGLNSEKNLDFSNINLSGANLTGVNFENIKLKNTDLSGANLTGSNLTGADLTNANLTGANLTSASLKKTNFTKSYLVGANLSNANLEETNFREADLRNAKLNNTNAKTANFTKANLYFANLTETKQLHLANLKFAVLSESKTNSKTQGGDSFLTCLKKIPKENLEWVILIPESEDIFLSEESLYKFSKNGDSHSYKISIWNSEKLKLDIQKKLKQNQVWDIQEIKNSKP